MSIHSAPAAPSQSMHVGIDSADSSNPSADSPAPEMNQDRERIDRVGQKTFSGRCWFASSDPSHEQERLKRRRIESEKIQQIGPELPVQLAVADRPLLEKKRKADGMPQEALLPPSKKKKEKLSPHISSLPTNVTATIASFLSLKEQASLAGAAASRQTENVTEGIALARLSFFESLSISASQEVRDEFYSTSGQPFPSIEAFSKMREDRDQSKLGKIDAGVAKQIDQEIGRTLKLLEDCMRRGWEGQFWLQCFYENISTTIDLRNPNAVQEIFSAVHTLNLVNVGADLKTVKKRTIRTKAQFLEAEKAVVKRLTEDNPPITKLYLLYGQTSSIPLEVTRLKNLELLYLNFVPINVLPKEMGNLPKLTKLSLRGNKYTSLPKGLENLTGLQCLDISGNALRAWPDQLEKLPRLTKLAIHHNPLSISPNQLLNLPKLDTVYVSVEQLKDWTMQGRRLVESKKTLSDIDVTEAFVLARKHETTPDVHVKAVGQWAEADPLRS